MQAPPELQALGELQRNLGQGVMDAVFAAVNEPWKEVCLDLRLRPGQNSHVLLFQVTLVSGAVLPIRPSGEIITVLRDIAQTRGAFSREPWSGMKLVISQDGQCTVSFNYDPKGADDPNFLKG